MKKIIFSLALLAVAVSLTACANQEIRVNVNVPPESNLTNTQSNQPNQFDQLGQSDQSDQSNELNNQTNNNPMTITNPDKQTDLTKQYSQAVLKTNYGAITVKFYGSDSPVTVNNFLNLAKAGFYNDTKFHRVIKDFMIQGGDPLSKEVGTAWGTGGPGYKFADEFNSHKLVAGSLAMANAGANTNGSQFFIVTAAATPWLDGHHTNFGEVISGMDVVKKIEAAETDLGDRPIKEVVVNEIELLK